MFIHPFKAFLWHLGTVEVDLRAASADGGRHLGIESLDDSLVEAEASLGPNLPAVIDALVVEAVVPDADTLKCVK